MANKNLTFSYACQGLDFSLAVLGTFPYLSLG